MSCHKMRHHLAAVLLVIAAPVGAAEFKVFPPAWDDPGFIALPFAAQRDSDPRSAECRILMTGQIKGDDLAKLQQITGMPWNGEGDAPAESHALEGATLCLDSPGGSIEVALKMAQHLLDSRSGIATKVLQNDLCVSACSAIFMAGSTFFEGESYETTLTRELQPGARLGVHAPSLQLSKSGSYSGEQISKSFNLALMAARQAFDFSNQTDSAGTPIIAPYVFARFLETPPEDMYFFDTVGDALLGGFDVSGYDARVRLDETLARTICDNVFMLDQGMFSWALGPTWKSGELLSAKETAQEFRRMFPDKGRGRWLAPVFEDSAFVDQAEIHNGHFYGRAAGYPTGYPYDVLDCMVRIEHAQPLGAFKVLQSLERSNDNDPIFWDIEVRVSPPPLSGGEQTPSEAWETAIAEDRISAGYSKYSWLIAYPFEMALADLPQPDTAPVAQQDAALSCDALWHRRNQLFYENGYCFGGTRGIATFGNDNCYTKEPDLSPAEADEIARIKQMERDQAC
ncbi:YARHG domain-containing protein [Parasedimentitalea marina]|uniref:YARHG domain-containing protein n=1 Tax=Parasedimentitalea marina TaxID=2483033 RepID=A0A3T0N7D2_9RHOB|nr:YARHG domain-containing protein [Parasedimentitalea marina]AZV79881.1 YARHG domain-containing protein [Parasedimentitalea marina]